MDVEQVEDADYVLQFWSAEKGGFFDGTIETVGAFDPKKIKNYNIRISQMETIHLNQ